jgi:hypothetical protein
MKYLIPLIFLALVACSQEKQKKANQEPKKEQKKEDIKEQTNDFSKEKAVAHIRDMFSKINEQAKTAEIIEKEMMEESAEGGQLKAYKHDGKIIKIKMLAFGETGRATKEYYFEDENLIFAFTKEEYYDRPMYVEGAKISKTIENRYYFYNEKLFKWLDPEKKEIDLQKAVETSENIVNEAKDYLSMFSK